MLRVLCVASLLFAVPSDGIEMAVNPRGITTGVVRRMAHKSTQDAEYAATEMTAPLAGVPTGIVLSDKEHRGGLHDLPREKVCNAVVAPSGNAYNLSQPAGVQGRKSSWSQVGQDVRLDKVLGSIKGGFFVESGAADGETNSNTLFYEKKGWNGLLVEPNPNTFTALLAKNRNAHAFNGGLSTTGAIGTLELTLADCAGKKGDGQCSQLVSTGATSNSVQVPIAPLNTLLSCLGRTTVDFWSLDVEGVEHDILSGFDFNKAEVGLMLIEMNKGETNNKGIEDVMAQNGFKEVGRTDYDRIYVNPKYYAARGLPVPNAA